MAWLTKAELALRFELDAQDVERVPWRTFLRQVQRMPGDPLDWLYEESQVRTWLAEDTEAKLRRARDERYYIDTDVTFLAGRTLVGADCSQLELRVAAMLMARDDQLALQVEDMLLGWVSYGALWTRHAIRRGWLDLLVIQKRIPPPDTEGRYHVVSVLRELALDPEQCVTRGFGGGR